MRSSDRAYEPQGGGFAHLGEPAAPLSARAPSGDSGSRSRNRSEDGRHAAPGDGAFSRPPAIGGDGATVRPISGPAGASDPTHAVLERQTRLARRALRVPLARLTLLDDVPASFTSVDPALCAAGAGAESSAWRAFCERAAYSAEAICVAEAFRTERRERRERAARHASADLRAYAGVPVTAAGGRILGSFCVADCRPRVWSGDDIETLRDLAATVAAQITLGSAVVEAERRARADSEVRTQTALRQVEAIAAQLGQKATELDTIIEAIPDGVYVCDAAGLRTRVNAQGAAMLGLDPEEALAPIERFARTNKPRYPDGTPLPIAELPLARALRGETRTDIRFAITQAGTGKEVQLLACCAPIRDAAGTIVAAVTVCTDITELSRLERQKDDFLSVASHEMKTPLTSLKILTQLTHRRLQRAGLAETQHIARMERAIQRMELLVNDLLDSSRIESGRLALRVERCDLVPICRQIADEQMAAADRPIKLDLPAELVEVEADPERLGQVLANLLSNALKYSPPDCPVTLALRARRGGDHAELRVRDEGAGIPAESLPHLFERFYRVPGVQVQSGSGVGLGLGLYITKEIVQRHGGTIEVSSAVGAGTTFTVTLPLNC